MANTGFIAEDLLKEFNITRKRINQHISTGYVRKKRVIIFSNLSNIYYLSDLGKSLVRNKIMMNIYKGNTESPHHDYALSKLYATLLPEEQDTWQSESSLYMEYNKKYETTTDGLFTSIDNKKIAVEIITNNYSKKDIEMKKAFIEKECDDYIMIHIDKDKSYRFN
jgi:hypothetical protein